MAYVSLNDGVQHETDTLRYGLTVHALHHGASADRAEHYSVRLTLPHGVCYDHDERPGASALLALTFGTHPRQRAAGRFPGADAGLCYESIDITLSGSNLPELLDDLATRMSAPMPDPDEYVRLCASLRTLATRAESDANVQVSNTAHKVFVKTSPYAWPWPSGSYYQTRPALASMPPFGMYRRRHRRVGPSLSRLIIASTKPAPEVLAKVRASALVRWQERDGRFKGAHRKGWLPSPTRATLTSTHRGPYALPDGAPAAHLLYVLPTHGGAVARALDLLPKMAGWPFRVSFWDHEPCAVLALWETAPVGDPSMLTGLVQRVTHAIGPLLRQDAAALPALHLARKALDADIRARHRDPALLLPAYARMLSFHGGMDPLGRLSPQAVQRDLASLLRGIAPVRFYVLAPPGVYFDPNGARAVLRRPVEEW